MIGWTWKSRKALRKMVTGNRGTGSAFVDREILSGELLSGVDDLTGVLLEVPDYLVYDIEDRSFTILRDYDF